MFDYIIGWDIGGAHLKASVINREGTAMQTLQLTCPLWKGINQLASAMQTALNQLPKNSFHAVTMTGELVDCFANRHQGVCEIAKQAVTLLGPETLFYAVEQPFIRIEQVPAFTKQIASMNWHASAAWIAHQLDQALFVDMGSTTTDIIPIKNHVVAIGAQSDAERLANNTLVYTGVVRTPLMAIAQTIAFKEKQYHVVAEYFATIADVYRLLQTLPQAYDLDTTADGADKTAFDSARRLARMVGHDVEDYAQADWVILAAQFKLAQQAQLINAMRQHEPYSTIVGAGHGSFLIQEIADKLNKKYINIEQFINANSAQTVVDSTVAFPAYAVAMLARKYAFS